MLGILFMVLKIIGWVLLGILGLLLFLLLLILFVPVPYRVHAEYGEAFSYRIRIFGIRILPRKEKPEKKSKRRRRAKKTAEQPDVSREAAQPAGKPVQTEEAIQKAEKSQSPKADEIRSEKAAADNTEKSPENEPPVPGKRVRGKRRGENRRGRWDDLSDKWSILRAELTDEGNKRALLHVLSEIRYLLKHCGPRKIKADAAFSLGDPANTGFVTAALSICPFVYGKHCSIIPDFEAEAFYFKGWADIKGHVRMIHFLRGGLRLLFDKEIRKIIRKISK